MKLQEITLKKAIYCQKSIMTDEQNWNSLENVIRFIYMTAPTKRGKSKCLNISKKDHMKMRQKFLH